MITGCSIKAGWSPDGTIKYSTIPAMIKKTTGTRMYDGIRFSHNMLSFWLLLSSGRLLTLVMYSFLAVTHPVKERYKKH
jgi:hypothetical protein